MAAHGTMKDSAVFVDVEGNALVQDVQNTSWSTVSDSSSAVNGGANGPVGTTVTRSGWTISLTRRRPENVIVVDYEGLNEDETFFELIIEHRKQQGDDFRTQTIYRYKRCFVSGITTSHAEDGGFTDELTVTSERRERSDYRRAI